MIKGPYQCMAALSFTGWGLQWHTSYSYVQIDTTYVHIHRYNQIENHNLLIDLLEY